MSYYSGMENAEIGEGGRYIGKLGVGRFSFRVIRALAKKTRRSGDCTIVELELIESCNPVETLGQKITWLQKHSDRDMLLKNLKSFCVALFGYYYPDDKERIEKEISPHVVGLWDRAISQENFFCGKCITSDNYDHTTKETKQDMVLPRGSPFDGEAPPARVEPAAPAYGPPAGGYVPPGPAPAYPVPPGGGGYAPYPGVQRAAAPVPQGWPAHVPVPPGMAPPGGPSWGSSVFPGQPPQAAPPAQPQQVWNPATQRWEIVR